MKKTLLAVVIPAVIFSNAVSALELLNTEEGNVDFYGQLRTQVEKDEDKDVTLNAGASRAGIKANYALTDTVDVFGKVEFGLNFKTEKDDYTMKNRLHYAGVDTDFGKFTFGRQWIVSDDMYGADYSYFFGGSAIRHATLSGARHDSLIKYEYEGENFLLASNYGLAEDDTNQELAELYLSSSINNFNFHLGGGINRDKSYKIGSIEAPKNEKYPELTEKKDVTADLQNTYFGSTVEYTFKDLLIGFTYYTAELEAKGTGVTIDEDGYSFGGTYNLTDNATVYTGFEYIEQASKALSADGDGKNFYIGTVYKFNKWSRIYVEYGYADGTTLGYSNKGSDSTVSPTVADAESSFALGARVYW